MKRRGIKKITKPICYLLLVSFLLPFSFFNTPKVKALTSADKAAYTQNVLAGIRENPTDMVHFFKIDTSFFPGFGGGSNQSVSYKKDKASDACWKMIKADYFTVNGSFYLCYVAGTASGSAGTTGTVSSTQQIYVKKGTGDAVMTNMRLAEDADIASLSDYQKRYIAVMQQDLMFETGDKSKALSAYFSGSYENLTLVDKGGVAPVLILPGVNQTATNNLYINRPEIHFPLYNVMGWSGAASAENNNFYFKADTSGMTDGYLKWLLDPTSDKSKTYIKVEQGGSGQILYGIDTNQLVGTPIATITVKQDDWWKIIINRVYNGSSNTSDCGTVTNYDGGAGKASPEYAVGTQPLRNCINASDGGWLKQWFGSSWTFVKGSLINPTGKEAGACGKAPVSIDGLITWAFCGMAVSLNKFATEFFTWSVEWMMKVIGTGEGY